MATLQRALHRCLEIGAADHDKRNELIAPELYRGVGIVAAGDDRKTGTIAGVAPCQKCCDYPESTAQQFGDDRGLRIIMGDAAFRKVPFWSQISQENRVVR